MMGLFPSGVAIVTCGSGPDTHAVTVNSLTSVSLRPLLLLISIRNDGKIRASIEETRSFAVCILHNDQRDLSTDFAAGDRPTGLSAMDRLGSEVGSAGNVLVADCLVSLECRLQAQYHGGDHELFIGQVHAIAPGQADRGPLVWHRGGYSALT
jgi:flavin reductase (DIM6/NTAB) family NADH-FMN oxidoreductase RutF